MTFEGPIAERETKIVFTENVKVLFVPAAIEKRKSENIMQIVSKHPRMTRAGMKLVGQSSQMPDFLSTV